MKNLFKKKYIFVGVISTLLFSSVISIFVSSSSKEKKTNIYNTNLSKFTNSTNSNKIVDTNEDAKQLCAKLLKVSDLTDNYIDIQQSKLMYSILGNKKWYLTKKYKMSQLAWFNKHSLIKKNRYSKQVKATITNSLNSMDNENEKLYKIRKIISTHPDTFRTYLNKYGYVIPNLDFFDNVVWHSRILPSKSNSILNNKYAINNNSTNLDNISKGIEESTLGAESVTNSSYGIADAVFKNINFTAKIVTFINYANKYAYATPTSYIYTNNSLGKNLVRNYKSKILNNTVNKDNNSYFLNLNNTTLTQESSSKNTLYERLVPLYVLTKSKNSSSKRLNNSIFAKANVNYNSMLKYKDNKILYSLLIVVSSFYMITSAHLGGLGYKMYRMSAKHRDNLYLYRKKAMKAQYTKIQLNAKLKSEELEKQKKLKIAEKQKDVEAKANIIATDEINNINKKINTLDYFNINQSRNQMNYELDNWGNDKLDDSSIIGSNGLSTAPSSATSNYQMLEKIRNKAYNEKTAAKISNKIDKLEQILLININNISPNNTNKVKMAISELRIKLQDVKRRFQIDTIQIDSDTETPENIATLQFRNLFSSEVTRQVERPYIVNIFTSGDNTSNYELVATNAALEYPEFPRYQGEPLESVFRRLLNDSLL